MNENQDLKPEDSSKKEIDWLDLLYQLWAIRLKIVKWGAIGALVGIIIAFSIPKEYTSTAKLAPESTGGKLSGTVAAIAALAGVSTSTYGTDAVEPEFYPEVVGSTPFLLGLSDIEVETRKGGEKLLLRQYVNTMKGPWWSFLMQLPGKIMTEVKSWGNKKQLAQSNNARNNFQLTSDDDSLVRALREKININVDPKTDLITITVTMQDPLVAAIVADTVVSRLQTYISNYRTNKARNDLEYAEKINREARERYYTAQNTLADYSDRNQGLASQSARITRDRLENEAELAFTLYNQTSQQVQAARALVQAFTPVYAIISPPTVPLDASYPHKIVLILETIVLAALACIIWSLIIQPGIQARKKEKTRQE